MGTMTKIIPDFWSYCNRCVHVGLCIYHNKLREIASALSALSDEIKAWHCTMTSRKEKVDFDILIVFLEPCPFFNEKGEE
jgi:hypothetical protein